MNVFNTWWGNVIIYLVAVVAFTQVYKKATQKSKKDGALTVLLEVITCVIMFVFVPFFEIKWPTDIRPYLLTGVAILFYCLKDRLDTTVRKNLEASTVNILEQILNVFMIVWGILFFKEEIVAKKLIGAGLIILSNVMLFYRKGKFTFNRYVALGILANLSFSIALSLNIDSSDQFNIALYQSITLIIPALLIFIFSRLRIKDIAEEWKEGDKKAIIITGIAWAIRILAQLRAYQLGSMTTVATLCAVSVILNVFASYVFLKEKEDIVKKIVIACIIVFSIFLVK